MLVDAGSFGLRMTSDEIRTRLRIFNETHDFKVFRNVPEWQFVEVMYPHVMRIGNKEEQSKMLDDMFGPLPEDYKNY